MPIFFVSFAFLFAFIHWLFQRKNALELILLYLMLFSFGLTGIASFLAHVFYPIETAQLIGWPIGNPFQFEVGIANLSFGILAILSFCLRGSFLFAAFLGNAIWLWGNAVGHIINMVKTGNFAPGNAGVYFWADIFIPILIGIIYWLSKPSLQK